LIGEKDPAKGGDNIFAKLLEMIGNLAGEIVQSIMGGEAEIAKKEDVGPKNSLQFLTPGQREVVEAIEKKIAKIGFKTKIRAVYLARKEVFSPQLVVNAIIGAINQYSIPSSNSIAPNFTTGASYFFKKSKIADRKKLLMNAYKKRKISAGSNPFILNIEELATIWHFPMSHVKTPLLQKAGAKTSEPPAGLPVELAGNAVVPENDEVNTPQEEQKHCKQSSL